MPGAGTLSGPSARRGVAGDGALFAVLARLCPSWGSGGLVEKGTGGGHWVLIVFKAHRRKREAIVLSPGVGETGVRGDPSGGVDAVKDILSRSTACLPGGG